ncbi:MAG: acyltransferase family protein, partial [Singulisphaera sp.]
MPYRPDIDGLRAVAVLSVVFCHAGLSFPGGYVGVDVFFVISGYLITGLILKDLDRGTFSLADFWVRRIRRILPALLAVTVAASFAGWFLLIPSAYASLGKSIVGLALLVSNVQFWRETGYFTATAEEKPLLHTWSLAVEEQFYLFVPVLLLLARVLQIRRMFWLVALAAIASLGLSIYGTERYASATFYLLPTRAWELFVGVLLAIRPGGRPDVSALRKEFAATLGLLLILMPCLLYDQGTPFPGLSALPPVSGAALLISSGNSPGRLPSASRFLTWRPLVFVGLISYSLYLWHWPLFAFAKNQTISALSPNQRLMLVVASLTLGVLSWRYIEVPFRSRRLLASRRQLLSIAAFSYVALLCIGIVLYGGGGFEGRLPPLARRFADTSKTDSRYGRNVEVEDIPGNLIRLGDADGAARLLVWGDSHAMSILPAIDALCREAGIKACAATHTSTPPVIDYSSRQRYGLNERAISFNASVMGYIKSGEIRTVLLVASWGTYFEEAPFPDALLRTIDALRAAGVNVYFMNDVPIFKFDVPKALVLYSWRGWDLSRLALPSGEYERMNGFHREFLRRLKDRGVNILDPIPIFQARS